MPLSLEVVSVGLFAFVILLLFTIIYLSMTLYKIRADCVKEPAVKCINDDFINFLYNPSTQSFAYVQPRLAAINMLTKHLKDAGLTLDTNLANVNDYTLYRLMASTTLLADLSKVVMYNDPAYLDVKDSYDTTTNKFIDETKRNAAIAIVRNGWLSTNVNGSPAELSDQDLFKELNY